MCIRIIGLIILKALFYTVGSAEISLVQCNALVKTFQRALPSVTRSCRESNCPWPHVSGGNTCWITHQHSCHAFQVKKCTLNPFTFWGTILCAFSGDHRNPGLYQQLRVFLSKSFPLPQWAGTNFIRAPYGLRSPLWMVLSIPTERNSNILTKLCMSKAATTHNFGPSSYLIFGVGTNSNRK